MTSGNNKGGDWWTVDNCISVVKCPGAFAKQKPESSLNEWFDYFLKPIAE